MNGPVSWIRGGLVIGGGCSRLLWRGGWAGELDVLVLFGGVGGRRVFAVRVSWVQNGRPDWLAGMSWRGREGGRGRSVVRGRMARWGSVGIRGTHRDRFGRQRLCQLSARASRIL